MFVEKLFIHLLNALQKWSMDNIGTQLGCKVTISTNRALVVVWFNTCEQGLVDTRLDIIENEETVLDCCCVKQSNKRNTIIDMIKPINMTCVVIYIHRSLQYQTMQQFGRRRIAVQNRTQRYLRRRLRTSNRSRGSSRSIRVDLLHTMTMWCQYR